MVTEERPVLFVSGYYGLLEALRLLMPLYTVRADIGPAAVRLCFGSEDGGSSSAKVGAAPPLEEVVDYWFARSIDISGAHPISTGHSAQP